MVLTTEDQGKDEQAPLGASPEKTIYFSNNKYWSEVYAYAWTDGVVYLHLENVGSAYSLFVNDQPVAEVEDPLTPA